MMKIDRLNVSADRCPEPKVEPAANSVAPEDAGHVMDDGRRELTPFAPAVRASGSVRRLGQNADALPPPDSDDRTIQCVRQLADAEEAVRVVSLLPTADLGWPTITMTMLGLHDVPLEVRPTGDLLCHIATLPVNGDHPPGGLDAFRRCLLARGGSFRPGMSWRPATRSATSHSKALARRATVSRDGFRSPVSRLPMYVRLIPALLARVSWLSPMS
jgi:hypothetical protein